MRTEWGRQESAGPIIIGEVAPANSNLVTLGRIQMEAQFYRSLMGNGKSAL